MRILTILVIIGCLFSCKSSVPKDVLPPKKMQAVLWDVIQADEMAELNSANDSTFRKLSRHVDYYQEIFTLHKITKTDFNRSVSYYQNHPAAFKAVLDSLKSYGEGLQRTDTLSKSHYGQATGDSIKRKIADTLHSK